MTQQEADMIQGFIVGSAVIASILWAPRWTRWLVEKVRKW